MCMSLTVEPSPAVKEYIQDGEMQLANGQSEPIIAGGCTIDSLDGETFKPTDRVSRRY